MTPSGRAAVARLRADNVAVMADQQPPAAPKPRSRARLAVQVSVSLVLLVVVAIFYYLP